MGRKTVKGQTAGGNSKGVGGTHRVEKLPLDNWKLIGCTMASFCPLLILDEGPQPSLVSSSSPDRPLLGQWGAFLMTAVSGTFLALLLSALSNQGVSWKTPAIPELCFLSFCKTSAWVKDQKARRGSRKTSSVTCLT